MLDSVAQIKGCLERAGGRFCEQGCYWVVGRRLFVSRSSRTLVRKEEGIFYMVIELPEAPYSSPLSIGETAQEAQRAVPTAEPNNGSPILRKKLSMFVALFLAYLAAEPDPGSASKLPVPHGCTAGNAFVFCLAALFGGSDLWKCQNEQKTRRPLHPNGDHSPSPAISPCQLETNHANTLGLVLAHVSCSIYFAPVVRSSLHLSSRSCWCSSSKEEPERFQPLPSWPGMSTSIRTDCFARTLW